MKSIFENYLIKLEKKEIKEFIPKKEINYIKLYLGNSLYKEIFEQTNRKTFLKCLFNYYTFKKYYIQ